MAAADRSRPPCPNQATAEMPDRVSFGEVLSRLAGPDPEAHVPAGARRAEDRLRVHHPATALNRPLQPHADRQPGILDVHRLGVLALRHRRPVAPVLPPRLSHMDCAGVVVDAVGEYRAATGAGADHRIALVREALV